RLRPLWHRVLETWPRRETVIIGRERLRCRYSGSGFRKIPQVGEYRHHIDVGKRETVAGQEAAFGDRAIQERDFPFELGHERVDYGAIRLAVAALREDVVEQIRADQRPVHFCVDQGHPLLGERRMARLGWNQFRSREAEIEISRDRFRLTQLEIAVT